MSRRIRILLLVDFVLVALLVASMLTARTSGAIDFALPGLDALDALTISRTGQPPVTLTRGADGWSVEGAAIDPYGLADLEAALTAPVGMDQAVEVAEGDLDDYGLGEHAITVRMVGPAVEHTVRIGKVIDGRRTFVWPVGGETVYRARVDLARAFDRPALDWRERRVWQIALGELAALETRRRGRLDWRAERAAPDAPWGLVEPVGRAADDAALGGLANTLVTARAVGFVDAEGFEPALTLTGRTFDGRSAVFEIGPPDARGAVRVRRDGSAQLLVVPPHQAIFLDARADALRDRRVFDVGIAATDLRSIVIGGSQPIELTRRDDGLWRMRAPRTVDPLPREVMDGWLDALVRLQAVGFAERPPADAFETIRHRVDLRLADDRRMALEVGTAFGSGFHARNDARPGRVVILPASAMELVAPAVEVLTTPPELPALAPR